MRPIGFRLLLSGVLLTACASGPRVVRDEDSDRIEADMRPGPAQDPLPEGIALGTDAPPIAAADPHADHVVNAPARLLGRHRYHRGYRHPVRYHVEPKPGGSTPGLLP